MATWFITGCSTGIGRATAEKAAAAGHRVVATARRPESLDDLVARFPDTVAALPLEVRDDAQIAAAVDAALARFGGVDVVVNNAGIGYFSTIEESDPEDAQEVMDANFWGAAKVTTALLPHLRERRSGHIFTVSSIAGVRGSAGLGYYCASKFAVSGLMEALAAEVSHLGIRVTVLEPGPVRTLWIPSGAKNDDVLPDYEPVMRPFWDRIHSLPGNQPGSPAAAAEAMLALADHPEPPLHLICGAHAVTQTRAKLARLGGEVDRWEELSLSVDRPADA
ncbi:oxidoreductase [Demequina sp.]|uniref:oxidoreductase n=1 Tax=Demequina sp. TaxID=2050685 RepID=UPI0025ECB05A|nr:oxidoreductase [Demequina sp.]